MNQAKNEEKFADYYYKWDIEKTLKNLVKKSNLLIFDVGANNRSSVNDSKRWWPESHIHCF